MQYQVLIFGEEGDILSSQHYDNVPGEEIIDELLVEEDVDAVLEVLVEK